MLYWQGTARRGRIATALLISVAGLGLASCGGNGPSELPKGLHCVDDSAGCVAERSAALQELNNDKSRGWIKQPAPAAAYASGVRLFAYKQKKRELSCDELAAGRREADAGPAILRGPDGKSLTTAQVARGVMLAQEVGRELANEMKRRCKA